MSISCCLSYVLFFCLVVNTNINQQGPTSSQYKPSLCTVGRAGASHKACTDGTVQHDWYNHVNDNKLNFLRLIHVLHWNISHINRVWACVLETYLQTDMTISVNIYSHRLFAFYVTLVLFFAQMPDIYKILCDHLCCNNGGHRSL